MAGQKQPIELVIAKGKKNLTKKEIETRLSTELKPINDNIQPPVYLNDEQIQEFLVLSKQLDELKVMGETDVDALARFIIARDLYVKLSKKLIDLDISEEPVTFDHLSKLQDRYYKQCRSSANDLGLSISSRCKLVVPQAKEPPKKNKFSEKFGT